MTKMARIVLALAAITFVMVAGASPAGADPPRPTDYRSRVLGVSPPTDAISIGVVGGDSFLELTVHHGEVFVLGYRGERYLWFTPDGSVFENQRSPATVLNTDRYGNVELPETVDADADPEWKLVGDDGHFVWHDHRTHWMNTASPPGLGPGDQILEAVVPLLVDGSPVKVTVGSYWVDWSRARSIVIAAVIAAIVASTILMRFWQATAAAVAAGTLVMGAIAFGSVPAQAGPNLALWLIPALAATAVVAAIAVGCKSSQRMIAAGLWVVAGAELCIWAWQRRSALTHAVLPTNAPYWLDRTCILTALAVGAMLTGRSLIGLFRTTQPHRAPAEGGHESLPA